MYIPRVLVVEQDPALRQRLAQALSDDAYPHLCVGDADEALRRVQEGSYDVLVVDPEAGIADGVALMETVRARFPSVEIIVLAQAPTVEVATQALRLGAYDFLFKPVESDLRSLRQALRRVAEKIRLSRQNLVLLRDLQAGNEGNVRLHRSVMELNNELLSLYAGAKARSASLDLRAVEEMGLAALSHFAAGREVLFLRYDGRDRTLLGEISTNSDRRLLSRLTVNLAPEDDPRFDQIDERHPAASLLRDYLGVQDLLVLPLTHGGRHQGVVVVVSRPDIPQSPLETRLVRQFGEWLAIAFESGRLYKAILDLTVIDGLTGLYNHRFFHDRLRAEIARASRHGHPVSLLFCDIDDFKQYNDRLGHAAGDSLLEEIGRFLRNTEGSRDLLIAFRGSDVAARYGGEEFVVILPETHAAGALVKAERLRQAVERTPFRGAAAQPLGRVTVSIGVAEYPRDAADKNALIEAADMAMYRAKQLGKNRAVDATGAEARAPAA
jgi:diguanylate cyclase (GGDEF)-like protein